MTNEENMTWFEASQQISEAMKEHENDLDKMADSCPYDMKLAVTRWVLKNIADHGRDGGSYRGLIYGRLGFGPDAYVPLLDAGMFISNEFDVEQMNKIKEIVREHKIDVLKQTLRLCDEPGCYKEVTCGFPTKDGYRSTCGEHYRKYFKENET